MVRRLVLLVVVILGAILFGAGPTAAHTAVRDAHPGPGETVSGVVDRVVLEFLDPVLPTPELEVRGPDGELVPGLEEPTLHADGTVVERRFDPLVVAGTYQVDYRYVAADGDEQSNAHQFRFAGAAAATDDDPVLLAVSLRHLRLFLHLLAAAVWVGGQLTLAGLVPGLRALGPEATRRAARRFNLVAWPAFAVLVGTGVWNLFEVRLGDRSSAYLGTLVLKLVLVGLAGASAAVHATARSRVLLAVGGALGLLASLGAFFLGVQLS